MADISFQATLQGDNLAGGNLAFNVGSGSNRLLIVVAGAANAGISSVTYNGVAMTQILSGSFTHSVGLFYLVNPTSGSNTIHIDSGGAVGCMAFAFNNAKQTSVPNVSTSGNGTSLTITPTLTNTVLIGGYLRDNGTVTLTAPTNSSNTIQMGTGTDQVGSAYSNLIVNTSSQTVTATKTSNNPLLFGALFAGDSSTGSASFRTLLGVGV
jgi:hypothetical protein